MENEIPKVNMGGLTPEEQAKRAEANEKESKAAQEEARRRLEADRRAGVPTNPAEVITSIASSIKGKLEREEFSVAVDDETGEHIPARPAPKKDGE